METAKLILRILLFVVILTAQSIANLYLLSTDLLIIAGCLFFCVIWGLFIYYCILKPYLIDRPVKKIGRQGKARSYGKKDFKKFGE